MINCVDLEELKEIFRGLCQLSSSKFMGKEEKVSYSVLIITLHLNV